MSDDDGQNIVAGRMRQQLLVKTPDCLRTEPPDKSCPVESGKAAGCDHEGWCVDKLGRWYECDAEKCP